MKCLGLTLFATALMGTTAAYANCDLNGNCYNVTGNPAFGYNVQGSNLNTGSMWHSHVDPNGNQNGWDSGGNYWNYNAQSGAYHNFGTGQSCYGFGANRTCY